MPEQILPRYGKGERLRHGDWNQLAQTVEGHDRLVTGGGLLARKTGTSVEVYDPRVKPFDARLSSQTDGAYSWEEVQQFEGGVYESPAGARSGSWDFAPAYARSGSESVAAGTVVVLWPQFGGLFYLFDAPGGDARSIYAVDHSDSVPLDSLYDPTPFTRILFHTDQGVYASQFSRGIVTVHDTEPIVVVLDYSGAQVGDTVSIQGVLGTTAANGTWTVSEVSGNGITLSGSVGNGAFQASPDATAVFTNEIFIKGYPADGVVMLGMVSLEDQVLGRGKKTVEALDVGLDDSGSLRMGGGGIAIPRDLTIETYLGGILRIVPGVIDLTNGDDDMEPGRIQGGGGQVNITGDANGVYLGSFYEIMAVNVPFTAALGFQVGDDTFGNPIEAGIYDTIPAGSSILVRGGIITGFTPP